MEQDERKNVFTAVIFKYECTPHKAVRIKWGNICEMFCITPGIYRGPYKFSTVPRVLYALFCLIFDTTLGDTEQHSTHFAGKETVAQRLKRLSMVG